jgi:hypothetical protein
LVSWYDGCMLFSCPGFDPPCRPDLQMKKMCGKIGSFL